MNCPHCKINMSHVSYEEVELDLCPQCQGHWLDDGELSHIIETRIKTFSPIEIKHTISNAFQGIPKQELENTLPCPTCNAPMVALNFTVDSGIIIDRCPKDHGLWFDKGELEKAQQFREYWSDSVTQNESKFIELLENKYDKTNKFDNIPPSLFLLSSLFGAILDKISFIKNK